MSTRATVHFHNKDIKEPARAIVYRHSDGYPEGLGEDLKVFFDEIKNNLSDTRFDDPEYLAAKWVVWDSTQYKKCLEKYTKKTHILDFLGVGIVMIDPSDIEYRYHVICKDDMIPDVLIENI